MTDYRLTPAEAQRTEHSYVDWAAILAGAFVAAAVSAVATAFGSAIGLSVTSPYNGPSPILFYIALALWLIWITVSGFAAGGYIAGRMRRRVNDSTQHEVDVRDGVHGLIVWAVAIVLGALLASVSVAKVGSETAQKAVLDQNVNRLLRGDGDTRKGAIAIPENMRLAVSSIVARAPDGDFAADDRTYLSNVIASHTGLTPQEADKRVTTVSDKMKDEANKARKAGILLGFFAAATLALGAGVSWGATRVGGRHRDENTDLTHLVRTRTV